MSTLMTPLTRTVCDSSAMSVFSQSWYRNLCGLLLNSQTSQDELEGVRRDTRDITEFILSDFVTSAQYTVQPSNKRTCSTVRTLMRQVLESDGEKFSALVNEMDMARLTETPHLVIRTVLDSTFEDGCIHWLRIVAGYVFAVQVAIKCRSEGQTELAETVVRAVGEYIIQENVSNWIHEQGGWKSICSVYRDQKELDQSLKSVGYLLLTVGVGALFSVVSRQ